MAVTKINFYSKKNCPQCSIAARLLAKHGIVDIAGSGVNVMPKALWGGPVVNLIKVDEDSEALSSLKTRGFASVPVIDYEVDGGRSGTILGADTDAIDRLAKEHCGE